MKEMRWEETMQEKKTDIPVREEPKKAAKISLVERFREEGSRKEPGLDGILVTIGLCIIALLLCVVMKDSITTFIQNLVTGMTTKANTILAGAVAVGYLV